jgi:hypothetical protein
MGVRRADQVAEILGFGGRWGFSWRMLLFEGPASVSSIVQFGLGGCELDDDVQVAVEDVVCAVRICIH